MKNTVLILFFFLTCLFSNKTYAQLASSGYALRFNGSSNFIDCGDVVLGTGNFSVEGWYNFDGLGSNRGLIGTWASGWPSYFWIGYGLTGTNVLSAAFHASNGGVSNLYANYTTTAVTGWHHVAATFNRSGKMILYYDGIARDSVSISAYSGVSLDYAPSAMQIGTVGSATSNAGTTTNYFFKGEIDEVRIWSKVLSQKEVRDKMCTKLKGTETNLKAYWRLDEGSGTTVFDSSSSGYSGTMY